MPLRFDIVVQKLQRTTAARPKLTAVSDKRPAANPAEQPAIESQAAAQKPRKSA
jgi:hypothetical protein